MLITFKKDPKDPSYPVMAGKTPLSVEFNKRQAKLWSEGRLQKVDFEQVTTVLLEILAEDYNVRHKTKKKTKDDL